MNIEIIETKDGSSSLFVPELNETYHSTHGAVTESKYVFIQEGLENYLLKNKKKEINILEIGFGTGLNTLLTGIYAMEKSVAINYHSLETNPLGLELIQNLNYTEFVENKESKNIFHSIHEGNWDEKLLINSFFYLHKIKDSLHDFQSNDTLFDVIYFDAFAPSRQPDMWGPQVFSNLYGMMSNGGVFVTYCAQGQFKRDLRSSGFNLESIPGPPGKKEMTRGLK